MKAFEEQRRTFVFGGRTSVDCGALYRRTVWRMVSSGPEDGPTHWAARLNPVALGTSAAYSCRLTATGT